MLDKHINDGQRYVYERRLRQNSDHWKSAESQIIMQYIDYMW